MDHERYMRLALIEAKKAAAAGEIPVGAPDAARYAAELYRKLGNENKYRWHRENSTCPVGC